MSFLTSFRDCQLVTSKKQLIKKLSKSNLENYIIRGWKRGDLKRCLLPKFILYEKSLKIIKSNKPQSSIEWALLKTWKTLK